jgi:hypothetical protein
MCVNVVIRAKVWGTIRLMCTGTESVKGDRIKMYKFREEIVCFVW